MRTHGALERLSPRRSEANVGASSPVPDTGHAHGMGCSDSRAAG
jgi:hypothetical protein